MGKINQEQRAAIGWEVLAQIAKNKGLIRYGQLSNQIGIHHRPVRYVLGLIQDYCLLNQLPPITILVVNQSGYPGAGFTAWDVDDIDEGLQQVYDYNWDNLANPFGYAKTGLTETDIIDRLLDKPENAKDVYALIKVRGAAQPIFRKALLKAYDFKCAFCGFSFELTLQASHIIPWSKAKNSERLDVRNGILLCASHHSLFDHHYITLNDDYSICYTDPEEKDGPYSEYDSLLTTALHKKTISLPIDKKHWPKKEYLRQHREELV